MTRRRRAGCWAMVAMVMAMAATGGAQAKPAVTWLVFVDDLHVDFPSTGRLRSMVRTVLKQLPADGESVAMFSSGPANLSVMPTADHARLYGETRTLNGSALKPVDILADLPAGREVRRRADIAHTRLVEMVGKVSGSSPPRTAIIYISNGYVTGALPRLKMNLSPPIFAIDPRLLARPGLPDRADSPELWSATRDSLQSMAEASGGFLQGENETLDEVMSRITQVMRR